MSQSISVLANFGEQGGYSEGDYDQPVILVNIAGDDVTRGDTAGRKGLAREMARQVSGKVLYADENTLAETYPELDKSNYNGLLAKYLEDENTPSAVIGFRCEDALLQVGHDPRSTIYVTDFNETLSSQLLGERELVAHHHTVEELEEEGKKFDAAYPEITDNLISVFLVNPSPSYIDEFSERLTSIASHYPEATIFLCASRRTDDDDYDQLHETIGKKLEEINKKRKKGQIHVNGFKFDREAAFNPYKGLLARSDHFVLWGDSMSMMSEPLFTGKSVHVYHYHSTTRHLEKKKQVIQFETCDPKKKFQTQQFDPVNLTARLAEKLVEKVENHGETYRRDTRMSLDASFDETWAEKLTDIRASYRRAAELPEQLKENIKFATASVQLNGFSLRYFSPSVRADPGVASAAIQQNKWALQFVDPALMDNETFVSNACDIDHLNFEKASDRLKNDTDFLTQQIPKTPNIYNLCHQDQKNDENIAFLAVSNASHLFSSLPEKLKTDTDFVKKALKANPVIFSFLDEKLQDDDDIARIAVEGRAQNYDFLSERLQEDEELFKLAFASSAAIISSAPDKFKSNKDYMRDVASRDPYYLYSMNEDLLQDKDFMIEIVTAHKNALQQLPYSNFVHENKDVATAAIKAFPDNYRHVDSSFKEDTELALLFLKENPEYSSSVPGYLFTKDKDFALQAASIPGTPFCDTGYHHKEDVEFMLALGQCNKEWGYDQDIFNNYFERAKKASSKKAGFLSGLFKKSSSKKSEKTHKNTKGMKM